MRPETTRDGRQGGGICQFGVFELNLRLGELRKHGLRLKLQEQPLRILTLLVEQPGEAVTREQIQAKLWAPGTHVDFENAINSAVRKLRDALGDTAENPRFIETLSRRGYRFIAPVAWKPAPEAPPPPPAPAVSVPAPRRARLWAIALPLAAAAILLAWTALENRPTAQLHAPVPLTSYPGIACCPSFSPDGTRVAFSWNGRQQDNFDIYVKSAGPGEPRRVTENPAVDKFPAWSPDGRSIAFLRAIDERHAAVMLVPSLSGAEAELARTGIVWQDLDYRAQGPALAWSADGRFLFTVETTFPTGACGIVRISAETGRKTPITSPPPGVAGDGAPSVSPDGRTLAFTRTVTGLVNADIFTLSLPPGGAVPTAKPERATFDSRWVLGHAWSADAREIVFSSDRGGRVELWRTRPGSRNPIRVTGAGEDSGPLRSLMQLYLAVSWQGHRLAYTQQTVTGPDIWRMDIASAHTAPPVRWIASTRGERSPQYSPDGTRIAFHSFRSGRGEIWVCDADGSHPLKLTAFPGGYSGTPRWSPDGRSIAFDDSSAGNWEIYVVSALGGSARRLTNHPALDAAPSWSRDGNWIYFGSDRGGRLDIWKVRPGGKSPIQVTANGGFEAFESDDGRYLYYTKTDGGSALWKRAVEGGPEEQVVDSVFSRNFALTRRRIYFMRDTGSGIEFNAVDRAGGKVTTLARLGRFLNLGLTVSPDDRWALYSQADAVGSDLMLVEGFR